MNKSNAGGSTKVPPALLCFMRNDASLKRRFRYRITKLLALRETVFIKALKFCRVFFDSSDFQGMAWADTEDFPTTFQLFHHL